MTEPPGQPADNARLPAASSEVLTAFQIEVARVFFTLPASDRFLLAGGAALLAQHLTVRPTRTWTCSRGSPATSLGLATNWSVRPRGAVGRW